MIEFFELVPALICVFVLGAALGALAEISWRSRGNSKQKDHDHFREPK